MLLKKIKIKNFRCFEQEEIIEFNKLTTFVGNNSSGKTAAMSALVKIFGENGKDRTLERMDFHLPKDMKPNELLKQDLYIETVFEFPEIETESGINSIPVFFKHFVIDSAGEKPYIRIRLESTWQKSNNIDGSIDTKIFYVTASEDETDISDENKQPVSRHDLDNIRVIYVPAVRDPSKQLKNVSGTILYKLLEGINWSETTKQSIKEKSEEVDNVFSSETGVSILKEAIKTQWKDYDSDYRYTNAEIKFNSTDMETIMKKAEILFSPTVTEKNYTIDDIGDGLRSLFYMSFVNSMLEVEEKISQEMLKNTENLSYNIIPPILTIVAVEEPENHIAPQLMGKLINKLASIAEKENAQAVISSHSPAVIKRVDPETIRHFRICEKKLCTKVNSISFSEFKGKKELEKRFKYIKEAIRAYPEIYFSRLVILGEGDSEEIIVGKIIEVFGENIDASGISIVPLGGRFVNHFWKLLNELDIPYVTLLDLDRERFGGGWGRIKYVLKQLIECGEDRTELLEVSGGKILSDKKLEEMNDWRVTETKVMDGWIKFLEKHNVFFSAPLDIDFLMLEKFGDDYKLLLEENEGPYIKKDNKKFMSIIEAEKTDLTEEYNQRIEHDVHQTLKENGGDGATYTECQRQLMVWYNYFFLNRGKPSTHILALSTIDDSQLKSEMPLVLKRLVKKVCSILAEDPFSKIEGDK